MSVDLSILAARLASARVRLLFQKVGAKWAGSGQWNRYPAGTSRGGQFAPKAGGVASAPAPRSMSLPPVPKFATSNAAVRAENEGHARSMRSLAQAGDMAGLKGYTQFSSQSKKLVDYRQALIDAMTTAKPTATTALPNFKAALVDMSNVNAASHNARVLLIEQHAKAGAPEKILAMGFGTNTYAKKQAKLANETLTAIGSPHQVTSGQKPNTHPALKAGPTPPTAPAPKPQPPSSSSPFDLPSPPPLPPPAPMPASGQHAYKQAKSLADAVAQFEAMGMRITRQEATWQEEWMKQKIATAPPGQEAFYAKYYGPKKTKKYITDKSFLDVLNAVGDDAAHIANNFPAMASAVNILQQSPGPKALGIYWHNSRSIAMRKPSSFKKYEEPLKPGEAPWNVSDAGFKVAGLRDVFRHEAGHAVDYAMKSEIRGWLTEVARLNRKTLAPEIADWAESGTLRSYVRSNISKYGGTKDVEATAELIALYTSPVYKPGTIAKPLEDVLSKFLRGTEFGKSMRVVGEESEDFVSVSIPPPPPGYELLSSDGVDIQFRSPAGDVVQYVDMVDAGLFGEEDDDE